jgi:hypothetical protein
MSKNERSRDNPDFRAVAGIVLRIPADRPDLLLVELKTIQGPLRFSMPKGIALKVAASIAEKAEILAPDRSAN